MPRLAGALALALLAPWLSGFVLLSSKRATLPVTPEEPTLVFRWDGAAPTIKAKDKYRGGIYADLDDRAMMARLLAEAMDMWNSVPGAFIALQAVEDTAAAKLDREDRVFAIVTQKSTNLSSAAFALPNIPPDVDTIVDCDISIADKPTGAKELAFTLTHELGHCLGLGHSHSNYNAIMGYSRTRRDLALGADDIAGLIYLYPEPKYGDGAPQEIVACGRVAGAADGGVGRAGLLALALALPLAVALPRRRLRAAPAKTPHQ